MLHCREAVDIQLTTFGLAEDFFRAQGPSAQGPSLTVREIPSLRFQSQSLTPFFRFPVLYLRCFGESRSLGRPGEENSEAEEAARRPARVATGWEKGTTRSEGPKSEGLTYCRRGPFCSRSLSFRAIQRMGLK